MSEQALQLGSPPDHWSGLYTEFDRTARLGHLLNEDNCPTVVFDYQGRCQAIMQSNPHRWRQPASKRNDSLRKQVQPNSTYALSLSYTDWRRARTTAPNYYELLAAYLQGITRL